MAYYGRDTTGEIILYGGTVILAYYVLKSWGIITTNVSVPTSDTPQRMTLWKPLTSCQLNTIRSKLN